MLQLYNANTDVVVDERGLFNLTESSDLILVYGTAGSGHDLVARAMTYMSRTIIDWTLFTRIVELEMKSGLRAEVIGVKSKGRVCWYMDEFESMEDRKLEALVEALTDGARVLAFIHASNALDRLKQIYRNSGKSDLLVDLESVLSSRKVATIEVSRPEYGGDVFVKTVL